jgi:hypothetical protein
MVLLKRFIPFCTASSKPLLDDAEISVVLAMLIVMTLQVASCSGQPGLPRTVVPEQVSICAAVAVYFYLQKITHGRQRKGNGAANY